jgi:hypothetical protein
MKLRTIISAWQEKRRLIKASQERSSSLNGSTVPGSYGLNPETKDVNASEKLIDYGSIKVYDNIEDLPMLRYVKMDVESDTKYLIISGSPEKEQLEHARLNIISQFREANPNSQSKEHFDTIRKIDQHVAKIVRVTSLLEGISMGYHPGIVEQLHIDGFKFDFTAETIEKDIEKVEEGLRGEVHKLTVLQEKLKELDKGNTKNKKNSIQDYIRAVNQYNAAFGTKYSLYNPEFKTIEYCSMMTELKEHYQPLKTQQNGSRATH